MKKLNILYCLVLVLFSQAHGKERQLELYSPHKKTKVALTVSADGNLFYSMDALGKTVIEPSNLGIVINGKTYGEKVKSIKSVIVKKFNEKYKIRGKHNLATNKSVEYRIDVAGERNRFSLLFRLFDDGIGYRYLIETEQTNNVVNREFSSFKLPVESDVWFFERKNNWKLKSYAGEWIKAAISEMPKISPTGSVQGKPLMIELPNSGFLCISEAHLENYSGMRLNAIGGNTFQTDFTEAKEGFKVYSNQVVTPWRVILFAESLNQLVNSDVITSLNPSPAKQLFKNQSYIKPGKSVWSWITKDSTYMTVAGEKEFINNAYKIGFDFTMIDEGWETEWKDKWKTLKELCDYGRERKVGVWVWRHSNKLMEASERKLFLDSVQRAGAVGIKVDFMNSEAKEFIDFDIALLKDCAERKLMVNFHGCQPPSGESRTYPNEMTREGIRGMELNIMEEGPIPAWHNAALPFTRFLVGHGDYTPGFFSKPGETTWGHQFAIMYLFDSPFLCMAENPATIINDPNLSQIIPYLKEMPVIWDETVVLDNSEVGKLAVLGKRKGETWYIVAVNGENKEKKLNIDLNFLPNKGYAVEIVTDTHGTGKNLEKTSIKLEKGVLPILRIEPNGGILLKLTKTGKFRKTS